MMGAKDRIANAWLAGIVATALAYPFVPTSPRYYPLEHVWRAEMLANAPSMGWYAQAGWALLAGMAVAVVFFALCRRVPEGWARRVGLGLQIVAAASLPGTLLLLGLREFLWKAH